LVPWGKKYIQPKDWGWKKKKRKLNNNTKKKTVLITGCSSGFGYLTSNFLASKGYVVYSGVRKEKDLNMFNSSNIYPIHLDITWDQDRIFGVVNKIVEKEGKIDILINNAGFGILGITGSFNINEIKNQFETNLFGQFKVIKSVLPYMRAQKNGLIININSIAGLYTSAFYGVYSSSKFALEALTTALRVEESVNGIKVVSVNPGSHNTNFWKNVRFPDEPEDLNKIIASEVNSKLARFRGDPMNVVRTIYKIVNSKNPRKNYLVGWSAYIIHYFYPVIPQVVVDFFSKKTMFVLQRKRAR
jgi:short-subunit dehydrogenase